MGHPNAASKLGPDQLMWKRMPWRWMDQGHQMIYGERCDSNGNDRDGPRARQGKANNFREGRRQKHQSRLFLFLVYMSLIPVVL